MQVKAARAWIAVQKLPRHSNDIFSFVLGSVLAWYHAGTFNWGVFLLGLAAVFFIANGIYLTNEAQDLEGDRLNAERIGGEGGMGLATTGGTRVLVRGLLGRRAVFIGGLVFFALAIPLGLVIQFAYHTGGWTIPLGAAGILITYSYSNPPLKASYRGLGESFMMLGYVLVVLTAYYLQAGWSWFPLLIGLPRFLSVPALKIAREFPDKRADEASGKRTLVVIFGQGVMSRVFVALISLAIVAFIPALIITRSPFALLNLIPAGYFAASLGPFAGGQWHNKEKLGRACRAGFIGLLWTPVTLTLTFLLAGFIRFA